MLLRFLEANQKSGTDSDLGSAACRLPAGAGVGTVAEMVVEGVEYDICHSHSVPPLERLCQHDCVYECFLHKETRCLPRTDGEDVERRRQINAANTRPRSPVSP